MNGAIGAGSSNRNEECAYTALSTIVGPQALARPRPHRPGLRNGIRRKGLAANEARKMLAVSFSLGTTLVARADE